MEIQELVNAIVPNFPSDRAVKATGNREQWYKIDMNSHTLYVPPSGVLRMSAIDIDKFAESVRSFAILDKFDRMYDWVNIERNYLTTEDEIIDFLGNIPTNSNLACDIESRNLAFEGNAILALGIATDENTAYSITIFSDETVRAIQNLFNRHDVTFIWQNGKFDISRLRYCLGLEARVDEDTMLLHFVGINERRGTHGLKDMAQLYLQAPAWEDELDEYRKSWCRQNKILLSDFTYDKLPIEILLPYMMLDTVATFRLYVLFSKISRPECKFIYRRLIEASNVFAEIEMTGIKVNEEHLEQLEIALGIEIEQASAEMEKTIAPYWDATKYAIQTGAKSRPFGFNPGSPKQLKWLIEEVVGYPIENTNDETLTRLFEEEESLDFIKALKKYREVSKRLNTYVIGIKEVMSIDGRVRCTYNLHGTETGRLSANNPNMQNVPREARIKNIFCASDGYKLVQLDYSQAELRVLAALSGDKNLISIYEQGLDLHDTIAAKMFGPNFTKEQRVLAKGINFGIAYGLSASALAADHKIPVADAQKIINDWYAAMPDVRKFINSKRQEPLRGIPSRTVFGRERHYIITNENLSHVANEAINTPIQSIASDLTLLSLLDIHVALQTSGLDARIIATVHDSILIEVRDNPILIADIINIAKSIMENVPTKYLTEYPVPFRADVEVGYDWGELEKWQLQ